MSKPPNSKPAAAEVAVIIQDLKAKGVSASVAANIAKTTRTRKQISEALKIWVRAR